MSAGLYQCPSCGATLRVPAGASVVRCPQCKTELDIGDPDDPPPAAPTAPPLPFGPPAKSTGKAGGKSKPTKSPGKPAKAPPKPAGPVRAELVDEAAEEAESRARAAARRRAAARDALREQEEEEEAEAEHYEYLVGVCAHGRMALTVLWIGQLLYAFAVFLGSFGLLGMFLPLVSIVAIIALPLGMVAAQVGTIFLAIGFGMALLGPPAGRTLAGFGLGVLVFQVTAMVTVVAKVIGWLAEPTTVRSDSGVEYHLIGFVTYLPIIADFPTRLVQSYPLGILAVVIGALEYLRTVILGQLVDVYATHGKAADIGGRAQQCLAKVMAMMILAGLFRLALSLLFDSAPAGDFLAALSIVLHIAFLGAILEVMAYWLYFLAYTIGEARDVVTADRYILKEGDIVF